MTCEACTAATANPLSGRYWADCIECKARALAQSPDFDESRKAHRRTPGYQQALRTVFGDGPGAVERGHGMVKAWATRVRAHLGSR